MKPRSLMLVAALFALPLLGGCGNADSVPGHTADEQKLVDQLKNETPQQQIDRIEKGPMPAEAKAAMIQKIKSENGIK